MLPLQPKDYLILFALGEGDLHGYGIVKAAEAESGGTVRLDPANLYRALQRLTRDGLVAEAGEVTADGSEGAPRRYHTLTDFGREVLRAESRRLSVLTDAARARKLIPQSDRTPA